MVTFLIFSKTAILNEVGQYFRPQAVSVSQLFLQVRLDDRDLHMRKICRETG